MRALAAILAYLLAAVSGLATGYYATAPRAGLAETASAPRHELHAPEWAEMEAAAAFLEAEEAGYPSSPSR